MQNNYVEELKNGKQIRIKYNRLIHDWVEDDSGWMEELWCYDNKLDLFKCYYPTSTYEKDFYTTHTEEQTKSFMEEAVRDFNNKVEMFPSNIVAKLLGYKSKSMFEANEEERQNVKVNL